MTGVWKKPPADLKLDSKFIDIWRTPLDLPKSEIDNYANLLSAEEMKRAERFKVKRKYREYIISRGLLKKILGIVLKSDPLDIRIQYAEHDKPFITDTWRDKQVSFNVSHSHKQTVIALSLDRTLGIDIEHIRDNVEFKKLAKRFFSKQESSDLDTYTNSGIAKAFFACWTRKEAYVKALGDGISFGLSEFSVSVNPYDSDVSLTTHWDQDEASKWSIKNLETEEDYIAALATDGGKFKLRLWR